MRRAIGLAAISLLVLGAARDAGAVALGYTGTLTIQVANLDPLTVSGSGMAIVNGSSAGGHLTSLSLAAGDFTTSGLEIPLTDPSAAPIVGMQLTAANQAGTFSGSGGAGFGGIMPILGTLRLCTYPSPCAAAVANVVVPLSVGHNAVATAAGAVNVTVIGAPWTTGTAAVGTITVMGGVAPLSNTGAASGHISLVTPIFISTDLGATSVIPAFGILDLHFVPEPGTIALVGAGVAGLVAAARRRPRR